RECAVLVQAKDDGVARLGAKLRGQGFVEEHRSGRWTCALARRLAERPEGILHAENLDAVRARAAVLACGSARKLQEGCDRLPASKKNCVRRNGLRGAGRRGKAQRRIEPATEGLGKKSVSGRERKTGPAQTFQRAVAQGQPDGIADHQGADQYRAADRGPKQRAQMSAGVKAEAAENEGAGGHKGAQ